MIRSLSARLQANYKSGIAVALVNIPLSLALSVASLGNYPSAPLMGILTAIWWGLIASFFSSSKHNIFGPAGALSGILLTFSLLHGAQFVPLVAIGAGVIIFLVYIFKLSKYITLIPSSALHGFLLGVGITIAVSQLNNAFWITPEASKDFVDGLIKTFSHISEINITAFLTFALSFLFLQVWKKKVPSIPGALPITLIGIGVGYASLKGWIPMMDRIDSKFPTLTFEFALLPSFTNLQSIFSLDSLHGHIVLIKSIGLTSFVVAIVAVLETLISAKIVEGMTKTTFNKDKEVRGLALANIFSGLSGGLPATAVLVRTALNAKSGANDRISASIAALGTLLLSAIGFGLFKLLPMSVVAAILMSIAIGMVEVHLYRRIWKYDRFAFSLTMLTAVITVLDDPLVAILATTAIALLVFIKKVSDGNVRVSVFRNGIYHSKIRLREYLKGQQDGDILIYKFNGSLTYLNTESQLEQVERLRWPKQVIFSFSNMHNVDLDGLEALEKMVNYLEKRWVAVYFSGVSVFVEHLLGKTHFFHQAKHNGHVYETSSHAIDFLGARSSKI